MAWACKILADSVAPSWARLTTFELTYPRFIHSELMTHRALSRNAASSRAIPIEKMIRRVQEDPAMPVWWGRNQRGMQALEELDLDGKLQSMREWLNARDEAVKAAEKLLAIGAHKQIVNRVLEPWMWITVIVSATEWANFFSLRCHRDAQPEFQKIAKMALATYASRTPDLKCIGELHLPLVTMDEWKALKDMDPSGEYAQKVSTGRCARVSYLTHDGRRDFTEDVALHDKLIGPGHWSPFEHVATALADGHLWSGNFRGWHQYRKQFANENRTDYKPSDE